MTSLHLAGRHDNSGACLELLLQHSADLTIHDNKVNYIFNIVKSYVFLPVINYSMIMWFVLRTGLHYDNKFDIKKFW